MKRFANHGSHAQVPNLLSEQSPIFLLNNRRRMSLLRLVVALFVVGVLCLTLTHSSPSPDSPDLNDSPSFRESRPLQSRQSDQTPMLHKIGETEGEETNQHAMSDDEATTSDQPPMDHTISNEEKEAVEPKTPKMRLETDEKLEEALARVISLLPNEITTRGLLHPVEGTGVEMLRETGLRAREYKKYFEAWEDLHLVMSGDDVHIRDDVIQYLRERQEFAASLTSSFAQTLRTYEEYRSFLNKLSDLLFRFTAPYFADHMSLHTHFKKGGRGIVLSGGDDQALYLLTGIASLRRLGCDLPIEIMYLGESDLGEDFRSQLEEIPGVITRDLRRMIADEGWEVKGWAGKPWAILLSSFREAIFIDADALFFRNPEILFEDPQYLETGTLFFHDRIIMPESKKNWLKEALPSPISKKAKQSRYWTGSSGHMQESGVVVVDKWKHLVALLMVCRMNGPDRDGNKMEGKIGVYDMVYGDKETFWLGWELVGDLDYSFHAGDAGVIGTLQTLEQIESRARKKNSDQEVPSWNLDRIRPPSDLPSDTELNETSTSSPPIEVFSPSPEPQNYTICAPQLLHLDIDHRPLWFNGWILSNKFAEKKAKVGGRFELYLKEPTDGRREPDPWQLGQNNEACLTADETYTLTKEEVDTLDMIVKIAKEVGAWG